MVVVIEVLERRVAAQDHSASDRGAFREGTIARLLQEFGDKIHVVWGEPAPAVPTAPTTVIAGLVVHSEGYLPWEVARAVVAHALAVEIGQAPYRADLSDLIARSGSGAAGERAKVMGAAGSDDRNEAGAAASQQPAAH